MISFGASPINRNPVSTVSRIFLARVAEAVRLATSATRDNFWSQLLVVGQPLITTPAELIYLTAIRRVYRFVMYEWIIATMFHLHGRKCT